MLKISYAGCLGLSPAISAQLSLECVLNAKIAKKNSLKPSIFRVQGHSRSWMLTLLKSSLPVLVIKSSMSVSICNHFHARQANVKLRRFRVVHQCPCFLPEQLKGTPITQWHEFLSRYTRNSRLSYGVSTKSISLGLGMLLGCDRH